MNTSWIIVSIVIFVLCMEIESGTICLSCNNLAKREFCTGHEVCKNEEVCFIQKYSTKGNEYRYDVGCAFPELCRKDVTGHIFGKRSDHSHVLCHKCCNNTDVCNAHLSCDDKISVPLQKCLSCSEIEDPRNCKNITTCAKDEICYLHKYTTHTKQHLFDVGCKHLALCVQGYANILGRRSTVGVHQECESCCSGAALCNYDLQCNHVSQKIINMTCSNTNECIGNLVCSSGTCKCPSDQYYWSVNTCNERHDFNERCKDDHYCKTSLRCERNTCKCASTKYWTGSLCVPKKTIDLTCSLPEECLGSLYCIHGHCKCDVSVDYWNGSFCLTGKSYNESCSVSQECQSTFRCINNKCICISAEYLEGSQCITRTNFNETCKSSKECQAAVRCINNTCRCIPSEYWDGSRCLSKRYECEDIPEDRDGVYTIYPAGGDKAVLVYCIMRKNKKWTVLQTRMNGSVDFYRTWIEYKNGFGSPYGEYWLGNDNIHLISTTGVHELSIFMADQKAGQRWGNYSEFNITDESSMYTLRVAGHRGDQGDDALDHRDIGYKANGHAFTTKDKDNDGDPWYDCAVIYKSAWWYSLCAASDLNAPYYGDTGTMVWNSLRSISKSIIMIRRS